MPRYRVTDLELDADISIRDIRGVDADALAAAKADARAGDQAEVTSATGAIYLIVCVDRDGYPIEGS